MCLKHSVDMVIGLLAILKGGRSLCAPGSSLSERATRLHPGRCPSACTTDAGIVAAGIA